MLLGGSKDEHFSCFYSSCQLGLSIGAKLAFFTYFHEKGHHLCMQGRDVTTGATGATVVAPKFSDTLTLSQPRGQILPTKSAHHCRVHTYHFPVFTPLNGRNRASGTNENV